jgi:hypothetical protein
MGLGAFLEEFEPMTLQSVASPYTYYADPCDVTLINTGKIDLLTVLESLIELSK